MSNVLIQIHHPSTGRTPPSFILLLPPILYNWTRHPHNWLRAMVTRRHICIQNQRTIAIASFGQGVWRTHKYHSYEMCFDGWRPNDVERSVSFALATGSQPHRKATTYRWGTWDTFRLKCVWKRYRERRIKWARAWYVSSLLRGLWPTLKVHHLHATRVEWGRGGGQPMNSWRRKYINNCIRSLASILRTYLGLGLWFVSVRFGSAFGKRTVSAVRIDL